MIDLLVPIAAVVALFFWLFRRVSPRRQSAAFAVASAAALALCLTVLFHEKPDYRYVLWPSEAGKAGLFGSGSVTQVNGQPVESLGGVLARAASGENIEIRAADTFRRRYKPGTSYFWSALDSYSLEEMTGGLVFFPRRPIFINGNIPLTLLAAGNLQSFGLRIIAAQGRETSVIPQLTDALRDLPAQGVAILTVMSPSPDNGTKVAYYAPEMLAKPEGPQPANPGQLAQYQLGFSGLPVLEHYHGNPARLRTIFSLGGRDLIGPDTLATEMLEAPDSFSKFFDTSSISLARPRLRLLPHLYEKPILAWLLGVPGTYVRQILSIADSWTLYSFWSDLPHQYYLLDDGMSLPFVFFRLSSITASMVISLWVWITLHDRKRFPALFRRHQLAFLLLVTMVFQILDLFQLRTF